MGRGVGGGTSEIDILQIGAEGGLCHPQDTFFYNLLHIASG
jgi:hypothetical protein